MKKTQGTKLEMARFRRFLCCFSSCPDNLTAQLSGSFFGLSFLGQQRVGLEQQTLTGGTAKEGAHHKWTWNKGREDQLRLSHCDPVDPTHHA